ncbi:MAG: hypothetical protein JNJ90_19915 [Saprospiraceae bacterium]|jgi:hypothetical protein|nr:hypothetical protein [Saprospiraceae bacterium]
MVHETRRSTEVGPCLKKLFLLALLPALFAACSKDSDTPSSDADYFFVGKLDGSEIKFEITASGNNEMVNSNGGSIGPPDCTFDYGCGIGLFDPGQANVSVDFPGLFSGDCGDEEALFPTLFRTGSWSFGDSQGQVVVSYFDGADIWTSAGGTQPAGAVFNVSSTEFMDTPFGDYMTVRGTMSCTLYDSAGASKKLEAGSFSMSFRRYF